MRIEIVWSTGFIPKWGANKDPDLEHRFRKVVFVTGATFITNNR